MARSSEYNELYEAIAPGYYDDVYAQGKGVQWFWHHYRFAAVTELLPPSGERILDMGCGPGTFLGHYAPGYREAIGIDLAAPQIEVAQQRYGSARRQFHASDVTAFEGEARFDAIVSIEVIEHLPPAETQPFLRTLLRLLKPGGTLVLTTPNYRSLWPVIEYAISRKGPVDYTVQHINRFHVARLERELAAAGFVVTRKRTFFVVAPFLAALSTRLAKAVYAIERRLLPWAGSEIVVGAQKPA
jgi:2-polyprenyl-3-methyl-5-hydroxy-6-metoxy-1,4-benzoquinol methylase